MKEIRRNKNPAQSIRFLKLVLGILKNAMRNICGNRKRKEEKRKCDSQQIDGCCIWAELQELEQRQRRESIKEGGLMRDADVTRRLVLLTIEMYFQTPVSRPVRKKIPLATSVSSLAIALLPSKLNLRLVRLHTPM